MEILADDDSKPGVTLDELKPCLQEEVSNVWRLWKASEALMPLEPSFDMSIDAGERSNRTTKP